MNDLKDIIEEIKSRCDIVDVISDYMQLKSSGSNYTGLCPFHSEKTGSFMVSKSKQIYKCFGCNAGGDVISFVMRYENVDFMDAVKILARRCGITLERNISEEEKQKIQEINKFREIHTEAARFYFANLLGTKNPGYEYLKKRGLSDKIIKKFGLGYSLNSWNSLMNYLLAKGYDKTDLVKCGLVTHKTETNKYFDRFRNRVIFPVFDYQGRVIGFGGRVLDDSKPKYLNSPETLVFQKGTNLYGLNFALKHNMSERYFVIVEGYMDLISLHQYGITNVVASLGTALTINQARLLKRYADKVIISYDADMAGQMATLRGLEILRTAGFDVRVLNIPQGKDPDEYVRSNGKEAFLKLINSAEPLIDYRMKKAEEGIDFKNSQSLILYAKRIMEIISDLDPVEKDVYIKKASENTGIKEQTLYDILKSRMKDNRENNFRNNKEEDRSKLYVEPGFLKAERTLLKMMLENNEYLQYIEERISENDFILLEHKEIFTVIILAKGENKNNIESFIESRLSDVKTIGELVKIKEENIFFADNIKVQINDLINEIISYKLKQRIDQLRKEQKQLENEGKIEESIKLAIELASITKKLKEAKRV